MIGRHPGPDRKAPGTVPFGARPDPRRRSPGGRPLAGGGPAHSAAERVNSGAFREAPGWLNPADSCCPERVMDQPDGPPAGTGPPGQGTHGDNKDIMSLAGLLTILDDDPQLHDVVAQADDDAAERGSPVSSAADAELTGEDLVAPPTLRPVLAAALTRRASADSPRFVLAVTATAREAEDLAAGLGSFLPPGSVAVFPGWETLPHERLSPRSDTVGQRIAGLRRLAHPADPGEPNGPLTVVVAPIRSLLQPIVAGLGDLEPVSLQAGQVYELDDLLARLVEIGYSRVDLVTSRGEIAVRGGIVDVFPPTEEHPLRVEFFGDTVEEIRSFKVADQRSIGLAGNGLWAPPCRELLLTPAVRARAKELADNHPALADILGQLGEGIPGEGRGASAPLRPRGAGPGKGAARHPPGPGRHPRQAGRGHSGGGHGRVRPGARRTDGA